MHVFVPRANDLSGEPTVKCERRERLRLHPFGPATAVLRIQRITISVPAKVVRRVKKAVRNRPVSAWVTGLIDERLEDPRRCRDAF